MRGGRPPHQNYMPMHSLRLFRDRRKARAADRRCGKHVATEMALHVLAYNMTRVIAILGVPRRVKAMKT